MKLRALLLAAMAALAAVSTVVSTVTAASKASPQTEGAAKDLVEVEELPPAVATQLEGAHFRVLLHFDDPGLAAAALDTLEAAWALATRTLPSGVEVPAEALSVHLYARRADYRLAERDLTGGRYRDEPGFTLHHRLMAHLILLPAMNEDARAADTLPHAYRIDLIQAAASLFGYACWPDHRQYPLWLTEALGAYLESELSLEEPTPLEERVVHARAVVLMREAVEQDRLPPLADIVRDRFGELEHESRRAVCGLLLRYLTTRSRREEWRGFLARAADLRPGASFDERFATLLEGSLGDPGLRDLEACFRTWCEGLGGDWWPLRGELEQRGSVLTQTAPELESALCWRRESVGIADYAVHGELWIHAPGQHLELYLGRSAEGASCVRFTAGEGLGVFRVDAQGSPLARSGYRRTDLVVADQIVPFRIEIRGDRMSLTLAGQKLLVLPLSELDRSGSWGLGAGAGTLGRWIDLTFEPLPPAGEGG